MPSIKQQKRTSDALTILDKMTGDAPKLQELLVQERTNVRIAQQIYDLRTKTELSQGELAKKVGTTQSVISRLEDADYDGHSLAMLQRIASALNKRVEVRFIDERPPARKRLKVA